MTTFALKIVLGRLHQLSKAAREVVRGRLLLLSEVTKTPVEDIYSAIRGILGSRYFFPSLDRLKKSKVVWPHFRNGAETLDSFITEVFGYDLMKVSRMRLRLILLQCIIDDLPKRRSKRDGFSKAECKTPKRISPFNIASGMVRVAVIVELNFPGYIESGLLASALLGKKLKEVV